MTSISFSYAIANFDLRAVDASEYRCLRIDKTSFTGDILGRIRGQIESAVAVIADLKGANPNVYLELELGYAWGRDIPTVLLKRVGEELCFDVRGQRCLKYRSIKHLEELLTQELKDLRSAGSI